MVEQKPRIYTMSFASVYPLYLTKAERKGRTKAEVWMRSRPSRHLRMELWPREG